MIFKRLPIFAAMIACAGLTACGKAEEQHTAAPPAEHGVFVSSTDCAERGKLTLDECGHAIDQAVAVNAEQSTVYKSLRQCEATEGLERCDRIGENEYRARIQAFFVTMSDPATAVALFPPQSSKAAFRSPSKQELSAHDESLNMSHAAMSLASENARLPSGKSDGAADLGDAAAKIH